MLDLHFPDWSLELEKIIMDVYGITLSEFCNTKVLPKYFALGYSPAEAFEELEQEFLA